MKRFTLILIAVFALAAIGCNTVDKANDKIDDCLEDNYGDDLTSAIQDEWELTCEDGDDDCDKCVDCVMDAECDELLDGECSDDCKSSLIVSPLTIEPLPQMSFNL